MNLTETQVLQEMILLVEETPVRIDLKLTERSDLSKLRRHVRFDSHHILNVAEHRANNKRLLDVNLIEQHHLLLPASKVDQVLQVDQTISIAQRVRSMMLFNRLSGDIM